MRVPFGGVGNAGGAEEGKAASKGRFTNQQLWAPKLDAPGTNAGK